MPDYPKKHHFVPKFLLRNFAGVKEKLIVHEISRENRYLSTVKNVGHRNLGHSIYWPNREPDHISLETAMSRIEGDAAAAVRTLKEGRGRAVPFEVRQALAWLLALQWSRSRFLIHVVTRQADSGSVERTPNEAQSSMMRMLTRDVIWPWSVRNDEDAHYKDRWNFLVSTLLSSSMSWSCYRVRDGGLLIGDNLVCFSGIVGERPPGIPATYFDHGIGVGFNNFLRLTFPISRDLAVIVSRNPDDLLWIRAADINRFTVFNSREFVAHDPNWQDNYPKLASDLPGLLETQRTIAPVFLYGYNGRT